MSRRWTGILLPVLIVAAAAAVRLWRLDEVPLGLHNDEAWTGINAREVLRDGWIGPYLYPSGIGQPAGPVYFTALLFTVLPQNTFVLRLSMALLGVATVGLTYLAVAEMFDRPTSLLSAVLLAAMPWHLHLSRTGFMVGAWPCIEMAILWLLFRARRRPSTLRYAGVGLLVGLGVYTYNAYVLCVPVVMLPLAYDLVAALDPGERRRVAIRISILGLTAVWAALLMVGYAATHEEYFWHQRDVSVFSHVDWKNAGWAGRMGLLAARGSEWASGLIFGGRPDLGDGLAARGYPLLDPLTSGAAVAGTLLAARRWRRPEYGVLLAAVVLLPFGALLTIDDGLYRRTFALAPLIATLAALPLVALWQWSGSRRAALRAGIRVAIAGSIAAAAADNLHAYFGPLQGTAVIADVFPYQLDAAARFVAARVPPEAVVYLYSDQWEGHFETIQWYAPDAQVVDRSREFRRDQPPDAPLDLDLDPARPTVFLLLGKYLDVADQLRARYPEAEVAQQERNGEILYRAVLPRGPQPIAERR